MKLKLEEVKNWPAWVKDAHWMASVLATLCGVSKRRLEWFFLTRTGMTPHQWIHELRLYLGLEMLLADKPVKVVAADLEWCDFSRDFRVFFGVRPRKATQSLLRKWDFDPRIFWLSGELVLPAQARRGVMMETQSSLRIVGASAARQTPPSPSA